jgi:hypothetical protein
MEKRKVSCPCRGIEYRFLGPSASSLITIVTIETNNVTSGDRRGQSAFRKILRKLIAKA